MITSDPFLRDIDDLLRSELATSRYIDSEQGGIYHPSVRPVKRLGLMLEPFADLPAWIAETQVDALWIHRPWQLDLAILPPDIGVLSHHLPFDETLTMGYNLRLASSLGARNSLEPLGYKQTSSPDGDVLPPRHIGMLIDVESGEFDTWLDQVKQLFGGYERAEAGLDAAARPLTRIAVVGAMTDALVREAAGRGAHLYLTGAYRKPAQQAVDELGIAVVSIGHRRTEEWGLKALAGLIREHWPIECVIHQSLVPTHQR